MRLLNGIIAYFYVPSYNRTMKLPAISNINWRQFVYHVRHNYMTLNNAVIAIAALIAISWAIGSVSMMQRNYALQRKVDAKQRELQLGQLEVQTLEFEKKYYQSEEYQELSARENLGLASKGEKVLILPKNSQKAINADKKQAIAAIAKNEPTVKPSNMRQWIDFLAGKNVR